MHAFDPRDDERREPSLHTPKCSICNEAGLPKYGGFCFRHALAAVQVGMLSPVA